MRQSSHHAMRIGMLALGGVLLPNAAQAATSATSGSSAEVLETIQVAVLLDMNFGKIAVGGSGGVVVLDPVTASRTCDPSLVCVGTFGTSELQLTGSDANVQVNFDPSFQLTGPGSPIIAEPQFPGGTGAIVHLTGGSTVVKFGARLTINPGQVPGLYSGQFSVNLEYN